MRRSIVGGLESADRKLLILVQRLERERGDRAAYSTPKKVRPGSAWPGEVKSLDCAVVEYPLHCVLVNRSEESVSMLNV